MLYVVVHNKNAICCDWHHVFPTAEHIKLYSRWSHVMAALAKVCNAASGFLSSPALESLTLSLFKQQQDQEEEPGLARNVAPVDESLFEELADLDIDGVDSKEVD